jgi:hypothetical protein
LRDGRLGGGGGWERNKQKGGAGYVLWH